jgi:hypothetical protein
MMIIIIIIIIISNLIVINKEIAKNVHNCVRTWPVQIRRDF